MDCHILKKKPCIQFLQKHNSPLNATANQGFGEVSRFRHLFPPLRSLWLRYHCARAPIERVAARLLPRAFLSKRPLTDIATMMLLESISAWHVYQSDLQALGRRSDTNVFLIAGTNDQVIERRVTLDIAESLGIVGEIPLIDKDDCSTVDLQQQGRALLINQCGHQVPSEAEKLLVRLLQSALGLPVA